MVIEEAATTSLLLVRLPASIRERRSGGLSSTTIIVAPDRRSTIIPDQLSLGLLRNDRLGYETPPASISWTPHRIHGQPCARVATLNFRQGKVRNSMACSESNNMQTAEDCWRYIVCFPQYSRTETDAKRLISVVSSTPTSCEATEDYVHAPPRVIELNGCTMHVKSEHGRLDLRRLVADLIVLGCGQAGMDLVQKPKPLTNGGRLQLLLVQRAVEVTTVEDTDENLNLTAASTPTKRQSSADISTASVGVTPHSAPIFSRMSTSNSLSNRSASFVTAVSSFASTIF